MKKKAVVLTLVALSVLTWGGAYGANITISDESGTGSGWYGAQEDQEVQPGCITGQVWDLEAFDLTGSTLTMVGGYDFVHGVSGYNASAGDIFIDVDGDAQYGAGAHKPANYSPSQIVQDLFGYDYVIDLNFATMTYSVINLNAPGPPVELLTTVSEQINDASNPWRYLSGGTAKIPALFKTIEARTGVPVEILNPFKNIEIDNRKFDPAFVMDVAPMAAVAVGLALRRPGDKLE